MPPQCDFIYNRFNKINKILKYFKPELHSLLFSLSKELTKKKTHYENCLMMHEVIHSMITAISHINTMLGTM